MAVQKCALCCCQRWEKLIDYKGQLIVKCSNCGLIYKYFDSPISSNTIKNYYTEENILEHKKSNIELKKERQYERIMGLKKFKTSGKLLELGCSFGVFLQVAKEAGFDVYGIEGGMAAEFAKESLGLNVIREDFTKVKFLNEEYDIVAMFHVLEHLEHPLEFLKKVYKTLKSGGIIVIEVPDIGSLGYKIHKQKWWYIQPGHLFYFSKDTLIRILKEAGYKVLKIERVLGTIRKDTSKKTPLNRLVNVHFTGKFQKVVMKALVIIKRFVFKIAPLFGFGDVIRIYAIK